MLRKCFSLTLQVLQACLDTIKKKKKSGGGVGAGERKVSKFRPGGKVAFYRRLMR